MRRYNFGCLAFSFLFYASCSTTQPTTAVEDKWQSDMELGADAGAMLDKVQEQTFNYFWIGGEPISGAAPERIHKDFYPQDDADIITSGGTGFGIMATIVGIERGFITHEAGRERLAKLTNFLARADRFHGAWAHWMHPNGKVKQFSQLDNGGDLVETAFLAQGLIVAREYFNTGTAADRALADRMDNLWREIDWQWYTQGGQDVLYWHWSPEHAWAMNHAVRGYNECTILYVLAAASPTYPVDPATYHEGYMRGGDVVSDRKAYGYPVVLQHNNDKSIPVGPLFWAHYSHLGLDPRGLTDKYADFWALNQNHALVHYAHAMKNPHGYEGYGPDRWGLTASYSTKGYRAHRPSEDVGVISPTAALSSFPYTPEQSMAFLRYLYTDGQEYLGDYGPYDAFSEEHDWYLPRYLAIDQLPIPVMIENYRTGLIWKLFMGAPEVQTGLERLGMTYTGPFATRKR